MSFMSQLYYLLKEGTKSNYRSTAGQKNLGSYKELEVVHFQESPGTPQKAHKLLK